MASRRVEWGARLVRNGIRGPPRSRLDLCGIFMALVGGPLLVSPPPLPRKSGRKERNSAEIFSVRKFGFSEEKNTPEGIDPHDSYFQQFSPPEPQERGLKGPLCDMEVHLLTIQGSNSHIEGVPMLFAPFSCYFPPLIVGDLATLDFYQQDLISFDGWTPPHRSRLDLCGPFMAPAPLKEGGLPLQSPPLLPRKSGPSKQNSAEIFSVRNAESFALISFDFSPIFMGKLALLDPTLKGKISLDNGTPSHRSRLDLCGIFRALLTLKWERSALRSPLYCHAKVVRGDGTLSKIFRSEVLHFLPCFRSFFPYLWENGRYWTFIKSAESPLMVGHSPPGPDWTFTRPSWRSCPSMGLVPPAYPPCHCHAKVARVNRTLPKFFRAGIRVFVRERIFSR